MTASPRRIRWGILGYAKIARESLMPAIARSGNSSLALLGSRDPAKREAAGKAFPGLRTCAGYEEVVRDPEVDAVYIPLPNSLHREWTIRAAEQGKHVLCEKPLALTAAEGREMAAACAAHRVLLMEAFMYRYTDRIRQVLEVVRGGSLGEIRFIHSQFRFLLANPVSIKLRPELGGGSLYDVGCYPINFTGLIADTLAGKTASARPESVVASCLQRGGVDQGFSALMRYPSGLMASIHSSIDSHLRAVAEIVGTEGVLEIDQAYFDPAGALVLHQGSSRRQIPVAESDRYRSEVEDFAAAILEGRPPRLGLEESIRNLEILDRLFAAVRE